MGQQIVVKGRASYLHAFEPHGNQARNIPPRYGVNIILPVGEDFTPIQTAIDAATLEKYPNGAPAGLTMPWAWGDVSKVAEKDHVILKAYAQPKDKPLVVDQAHQPILDPSKIYSGCEVAVSVNVYAHNNNGVSMYLQAIMLVAEGEHLDNTVTADVFGAPGQVPVTQPGQAPTAQGAPAQYPPAQGAPAQYPPAQPQAQIQPQAQMQPQGQPLPQQQPAAPVAGPAGAAQPGTGAPPTASMQPPLPGAPGNDNGFIPTIVPGGPPAQ